MPAMLDDPTAPVIYRTSGDPPYPTPFSRLPPDINIRHVTLRDRITAATLVPSSSPHQVPVSLLSYLCDQLNREIEKGDTYPMTMPMSLNSFGPYWFANFGAIMILGKLEDMEDVHRLARNNCDWDRYCLGSFYIKPNYPGRSSHVCNGGFLVTDGARNRGVGRLMGEGYLEWAPRLGYTYSVFNLVYETNVASCRIWDALGFKRIGRVKGCGNLRSHPNELVDAIIYGRDLGYGGEDEIPEERFDKIRYFLRHNTYPDGADRAEKCRLRSASKQYTLVPGPNREETLFFKGREVITDPAKQYEIAKNLHAEQHAGINKLTAAIADRYHWSRIKNTVGLAVRHCKHCKQLAELHAARAEATRLEAERVQQAKDSVKDFEVIFERPGSPVRKSKKGAAPRAASHPPASSGESLAASESLGPHPQSDQTVLSDDVEEYDHDFPIDPVLMRGMQHQFSASSVNASQSVNPCPQHTEAGNLSHAVVNSIDLTTSGSPAPQPGSGEISSDGDIVMQHASDADTGPTHAQPEPDLSRLTSSHRGPTIDLTAEDALLEAVADDDEDDLRQTLIDAGYGNETAHEQFSSTIGLSSNRN